MWFLCKNWDFQVAKEKKWCPKDHRALLEHSPAVCKLFLKYWINFNSKYITFDWKALIRGMVKNFLESCPVFQSSLPCPPNWVARFNVLFFNQYGEATVSLPLRTPFFKQELRLSCVAKSNETPNFVLKTWFRRCWIGVTFIAIAPFSRYPLSTFCTFPLLGAQFIYLTIGRYEISISLTKNTSRTR